MGKTAEELRWEIDQRRNDLTRDFDAIGDRVSPGRVMERKTEAVKSRFRNVKESVMGTADHATGTAHGKAVDLRDTASDKAHGIADTATGAVHNVADTATGAVHTAADKAGEVPTMVRDQTQGNPLAAGLVAFGLGLLAATVLPETRKERQLARKVQPQLQDAARAAADTGRSLADDLKPIAQDSATSLQESAKESAQNLTEHAKDAAQSLKSDAKDKAADVKDAARS